MVKRGERQPQPSKANQAETAETADSCLRVRTAWHAVDGCTKPPYVLDAREPRSSAAQIILQPSVHRLTATMQIQGQWQSMWAFDIAVQDANFRGARPSVLDTACTLMHNIYCQYGLSASCLQSWTRARAAYTGHLAEIYNSNLTGYAPFVLVAI